MPHTQRRFHTNGSNALKAQDANFDVFIKPNFPSDHEASIIDFDHARNGSSRAVHADELQYFTVEDPSTQKSFGSRLLSMIEHDRLLGDLFALGKKNRYHRGDLALFAKGFTLAGISTFVMILFGA